MTTLKVAAPGSTVHITAAGMELDEKFFTLAKDRIEKEQA